MHIFSNKQIKGYNARISNKGIKRLTSPPSNIVPTCTSFLGFPESTTKVKHASNVQFYNPYATCPLSE